MPQDEATESLDLSSIPTRFLPAEAFQREEPTHPLIDAPPQMDEGFNFDRSAEHQAAFEKARDEILRRLPLDSLLNRQMGPELDALVLDASLIDVELLEMVAPPELNWLQVEVLLDHSADLLDRALATRQQFDEVAQKYLLLELELAEYLQLLPIHQREEQAGLYDVPYVSAHYEWKAEREARYVNESNARNLERTADYYCRPGNAPYNIALDAALRGALVASHPLYYYIGQPGEGDYPSLARWDFMGTMDYAKGHLENVSQQQLEYSAGLQWGMFRDQADTLKTQAYLARIRTRGLKALKEWANSNRRFLRERTTVARNIQDMKAQAASMADGALNYSRRLPGLRDRWEEDVRFAILKLRAAQKGLQSVFGYSSPLPSPDTGDYLDSLIRWTRSAIQWIIAFSSRDETVVLPISLRDFLSDDDWAQGCAVGRWEFSLAHSDFAGWAHCRLRGITCSAVPRTDIVYKCERTRRLYRLLVSAPVDARSQHRSGEIVAVDQSVVKPITCARVTSRDAVREPDFVGSSILYNACPCGTWRVELAGSVPRHGMRADFAVDIADIQIDLHLVYSRIAEPE